MRLLLLVDMTKLFHSVYLYNFSLNTVSLRFVVLFLTHSCSCVLQLSTRRYWHCRGFNLFLFGVGQQRSDGTSRLYATPEAAYRSTNPH